MNQKTNYQNKLTVPQILEIIEEEGISVSNFARGDFMLSDEAKAKVGEWEEVDSYGGIDQGSTWYSVKYFKAHDVYIRTDGYYQSHYGTDFDYGYGEQVLPKQKTITVYE